MLQSNEVPSMVTLTRIVAYIASVIALGTSFSYSLEFLNTFFELGVGYTLLNVLVLLGLGRYIAVQHFLATPAATSTDQ